MKVSLSFLLVLLFAATPGFVSAQSQDDSMQEGIMAFRDGRYDVAERSFERIVDDDPSRAEAYFLLARLYTETPLANRSKANRALDKALELDPDNLTYLVGRLQQLRKESWNFITEKIREQKRIDLARHILRLDSTNAFAHEELGAAFIRDFWRYRNAIMLPTLRFGQSTFRIDNDMTGMVGGTAAGIGQQQSQRTSNDGDLGSAGTISDAFDSGVFDPNSVFLADRFDVEALKRIGVPIQDLSRRAHNAYDEAIEHLKSALATDPRRRSVYDRMMEIYALKGEYARAVAMLEEMYAFYPEDPQTWQYLGLAQYRLGNLDAADRSFQTALEYLDDEHLDAYRSLDYLLSSEEEHDYESDPVAYASRFWTSKDPRYLTSYNERKLEHYARLVYADLLYGSIDLGLRGWDTQRGRILVRYGIPNSDVVIVPQSTSRVNSTDVFSTEVHSYSGDLREEQARGTAPKDSNFDMLEEANTFNVWDYGDFRFVFEDPFRNGEYKLYSPSASDISAGTQPWLNDYVLRARETFENVPERYEFTPPGRQIELPYLVSAFKGENGDADVYVNYGIPITADAVGQETVEITANVGAFLISEQRDVLVERRQTIYGLRGTNVRSFEEANIWVDTQLMRSPPGRHQVSMEFETAGGGTVAVQRRDVDIPDFSKDALNLSDVMLAYGIEETFDEPAADGGEIVRNGLSISPAPWSVFSASQPIYMYFEVYNLQLSQDDQTDFQMEAVLTPREQAKGVAKFVKNLFGGAKGVSVSLPGTGAQTDDGHYLILDAMNQEAGLYTLTLRVSDNVSGRMVERELDLLLE